MKKTNLFCFFTLFLCCIYISHAQEQVKPLINAVFEGFVLDAKTDKPIGGATVRLESVTHSVTTDAQGKFRFVTGQKLPVTVIVSHIGYKKKSFVVEDGIVTLYLEPRDEKLDEVIVIGYGTTTKKDLVGSISKINADDVNTIPVGSFDAQLQGQAAGVQINAQSGIPGEGVFVRVRGTTSINAGSTPLYVVDGVFINNSSLQTQNSGGKLTSPIADINPADIASIEVLKDASATAIYGARGANGVVIVTTKRGNYESKPTLSYNTLAGVAEPSRLWDLASGAENAEIYNAYWINSGIDNPALNQTFANRPFRPVSEGGQGLPEEQETYDRLSPAYRTAFIHSHDLSFQGGTDKTRYYVGGSYVSQEATLRPVFFNRAGFKFNLDQKLSDRVTVSTSNTLSRTFRNQARTGDGGTGNPVLHSINLARFLPFENPDGTPATYTNYDDQQTLLNNLNQNTNSWRYIGNVAADIELLKGLTLRSSWGLDYNNYDEFIYWSSILVNGAPPLNGAATSSITGNISWLNEQTLTYRNTNSERHKWGALIGNTIQSRTIKNTTAEGSGFPNDQFTLISSASNTSSSNDWTKVNLASFFTRLDYNFDGKYFIEGTLRADGASNFGQNSQWGYFPSLGLAWRLGEENFIRNLGVFDDLKLRFSVGVTGNQNGISDFAARGLWSGGSPYDGGAGTSPLQLANPDLKWERTNQTNIGLDLSLWKGRLNITSDLYAKVTKDILLEQPVQGISGLNTYFSNAGQISNRGVELAVNAEIIKKKDFSWNSSLNFSYSRNKIDRLPTPVNVYSRNWLRMEEGSNLFAFWLYKQLYVDPQTGAPVYEDVNEDGQITAADRQLIGTAVPPVFGGFSNEFRFKQFDLNILFSFQQGNSVYTLYRFFAANGGSRAIRALYTSEANYWKQPGDITDVPRPSIDNYSIENTSRLLEDGSFIRLKFLTLGYNLPGTLINKIGLSKARIYAQGTNLLLLTNYHGPDPEANVSDADQNVQGLDWGSPPQPRVFQLGVNLTF